jgi:predicted phage terminase large subunit-like protein
MVAAIEEMISGDVKRCVINIHPRIGKSKLISEVLPMFLLMQNPATQIMCISYSEQPANQFHQSSRLISKAKWYGELNPKLKFKSAGDQSLVIKETDTMLQTTELGYRLSRSFFGSITGLGANWIIMDDPNDVTQIHSEAHRQKVKNTFDQTIASRLNNREGRIILVTQRCHVDDLSGHILEKGGFKHVKIDAIAAQRTIYQLGHGQTYIREKGELIDPRRFGAHEIEERRRDLGSAAFEAQYQQNPQPPDGNLFKRQWLHIVDKVPEPQYVIISGDIAGSLDRGDYTAFLIWHYFDSIWYLVAAHRAQLDLPGVIKFYRKLDDRYEPDFAIIEQNGLGAGFIQSMNDLNFHYFQGANVTGNKVERAESTTPLLEFKQVAFLKTMPLHDKFMDELLTFPSSKNDDMVDAFTLALTHRPDLLRVANFHRRPKRKHLPQVRGNTPEYTISTFGSSSSIYDNYFERTGRSMFS